MPRMLSDETWEPVSVHRVVLDFIRGEPHYWQPILPDHLHHVVHDADLDDGGQNSLRWRLLYSYRRYLMGEIPPDTEWYEVRALRDEHLPELLVIARSGFFEGPAFDLPSAGTHLQLALQTPPEAWMPPILWGHDRDGPFTVLEGNNRLAAYARSPSGALGVPVYVGLSPTPCYWHALDPPQQLVHDMWRVPGEG